MKKEAVNIKQENWIKLSSDKVSKALLICAVVLYTVSLILLANLALAVETNTIGVLLKVNSTFDEAAINAIDAKVKAQQGNIMAIDMSSNSYDKLIRSSGVCSALQDAQGHSQIRKIEKQRSIDKYAGANVVVGILDNSGLLSMDELAAFDKLDKQSNIGFISYRSFDPSSTVIIRNIKTGESNLIQALSYMQAYAKTIDRPLVIEFVAGENEMRNPLFVQVCQKLSDQGVQFLGIDNRSGVANSPAALQLSYSTFNPISGQITDRSDFWSIGEVLGQQIELHGSNGKAVSVTFNRENGFEKIHVSNASEDLVMITAIDAAGRVQYFNIENKESALIPRSLFNGMTVLEDGLDGIYAFLSKPLLNNGVESRDQLITLGKMEQEIALEASQDMGLRVASNGSKTFSMQLDNLDKGLIIELRDKNGAVVYKNQPDADTKSIFAKVDLSEGVDGLYFLDLTSPKYHQTFPLLMD